MAQEIKELSLEQILDPANPMRTGLEQDKLFELAESIKVNGLINPITVRPKGDKYEVVAGHRRFRACAIAGVFRITCVVSDLADEQAFNVMAAENLNRQDIDPIEEALFVGRLIGEDRGQISTLAARLNRSVTWVEDRLELLTFSDKVISALKQGLIKIGVAQWLGRIENEFWQTEFIDQAVKNGMSVLQARYLHDQCAMGVIQDPAKFMPQDGEVPPADRPKMKVICEACQTLATEPNIKSVFIHVECPPSPVPAA